MTQDTEHRGNPLPEGLQIQIRRLHLQGFGLRKIMMITGVSNYAVQKYIKGLRPHRPLGPPRPPVPGRDKLFLTTNPEILDECPSGDDEAEIDRLLGDYDPDPEA
jgi:hypothetical protein